MNYRIRLNDPVCENKGRGRGEFKEDLVAFGQEEAG